MNGREIVIGSRGSALALAQANLVLEALRMAGQRSRVVTLETDGDRRSPDMAWGEGAFVAAIEMALLAGEIDVAVHSAKDIPTEEDQRLHIAAYLPRADPRDALVLRVDATARCVTDLPPGSRVGTDSPRRTGFLLARRPDLAVHPLNGNVDTRLRRLDAGETDALILACAGLDRLGLDDRIAERLDPEIVPPAPGQGAIAVQVRGNDPGLLAVAARIDEPVTRRVVEAERDFLMASGGGCRAPIGALARVVGNELDLLGGYASPDGSQVAFGRRLGPVASGSDLGRALAAELGTRDRLRAAGNDAPEGASLRHGPRVLVTRAVEQASELVSLLRRAGVEPITVPAIAVELEPPGGDLDTATRGLPTYAWVVITSANGARAMLKAGRRVLAPLEAPRFAAIGPMTRGILELEGIAVHYQPSEANAIAMAEGLPLELGDRVLVVRGDLANEQLIATLRARGADVDDVIAYRTVEAPMGSRALLRTAAGGPIAGIVFTSGSTVRGLVALGRQESIEVHAFPTVCIGPETADEARASGFHVVAVSPTRDVAALAVTTATALIPRLRETS